MFPMATRGSCLQPKVIDVYKRQELELIEKKYTQMRGITIDENGNYIYSNDDEMDRCV